MPIIICFITKEEVICTTYVILLPIIIIATAFDLCVDKVPNKVIICGYITALGYQFVMLGMKGMYVFLTGAILPIIMLYLLFLMGALGAGDIKLLSVIGAVTGVPIILRIILVSLIAGAVVSCYQMIICRQLRRRCNRFLQYVILCINSKKILFYSTLEEPGGTIHFTGCILFAFIILAAGEVIM